MRQIEVLIFLKSINEMCAWVPFGRATIYEAMPEIRVQNVN